MSNLTKTLPIILSIWVTAFAVTPKSIAEQGSKEVDHRTAAEKSSPSKQITDEKRSKEKSSSELQKQIREISKKTSARRRALYKENEEINELQKKISEFHQRVNEIISTDEEYAKLLEEQRLLREEMKKHYDRKQKLQRSVSGRASKNLNSTPPAPVPPALPESNSDTPSIETK